MSVDCECKGRYFSRVYCRLAEAYFSRCEVRVTARVSSVEMKGVINIFLGE